MIIIKKCQAVNPRKNTIYLQDLTDLEQRPKLPQESTIGVSLWNNIFGYTINQLSTLRSNRLRRKTDNLEEVRWLRLQPLAMLRGLTIEWKLRQISINNNSRSTIKTSIWVLIQIERLLNNLKKKHRRLINSILRCWTRFIIWKNYKLKNWKKSKLVLFQRMT